MWVGGYRGEEAGAVLMEEPDNTDHMYTQN
jgi:hypothetical protein